MKYWKKSNGQCGTVGDNGFVPDSVEITKEEYNQYVVSQPIIEPVDVVIEYEDIETGKTMKLRRLK